MPEKRVMPEKTDGRSRRKTDAEIRRARQREDAFQERLDEVLMGSSEPWAGPDEARAAYVQAMVRAHLGLAEMKDRLEARHKQEAAEIANDDAERDALMARLAGHIARLEQEGADRCPACGRCRFDPERLARLGGSGADAG